MKFEDHFSTQSRQYAQFRPQYPDAIYAYFASIVPGHVLAWDCGTGNGQAAVGLAQHFERVYATDASADQIAHAYLHPNVEYHVESAEEVGLESASVDLVTVAQAVHWFDFDKFYAEVKRVLKPGGIVAVWTYHLPEISPLTDKALFRYYHEILDTFWSERIDYLEARYQTLPFPFEEISPPSFAMETRWDLGQLTGFIDSWSATQKYREQNGSHPLEEIWGELSDDWKDEKEKRLIRWPLHFRIGRRT
ncbi:MAG TPA: class I SAM-dependent methyltransferase [Anaerolineales bacterium]|nr:class I SAM-dependent methyltransferase [Anaerolineales bacterium]